MILIPDKIGFQDTGTKGTLLERTDIGFMKSEGYGPNLVPNGDFESWASATDLNDWVESIAGTSTINRESVDIYEGTYSCRFDVDALNSNVQLVGGSTLVAGKTYRYRLVYKMSAVAITARVYFRDPTTGTYLQLNGTWGATAYLILDNKTDWFVLDIEFVAPSTGDYVPFLRSLTSASSSIYWGLVSVQEKL